MLKRMPALAALVTLAVPVVAQEIAKSGKVDVKFQLHYVQTVKDLDTNGGMKAYVNEGFVFAQSGTPGGLLDGSAGRCVGYGFYSDKTFAGREDGRCTFSDADKDQVFEVYSVSGSGGDAPWAGTGTFEGGTGKYEGIKADFEIHPVMLGAPAEGHQMFAGTKTGTYSIEKTAAAN